jgi:hypothetical protein
MIQGFSWFQPISAPLCVRTVFGMYLFLTISGSVFVSRVSVLVFSFRKKKVKTNVAPRTQLRLYPLRFHPYARMHA